MLGKITDFLNEEYHRLNLWYLVSFVSGILFYLASSNFYYFALILFVPITRRMGIIGFFLSNIFFFFVLGIFIMKIRLDNLSPIFLRDPIISRIKGVISEIKYTERGANIVLENILFYTLLL